MVLSWMLWWLAVWRRDVARCGYLITAMASGVTSNQVSLGCWAQGFRKVDI